MGIVFHPSPLDAGMIGPLVQRYRVTILVATPSFLYLYMRRCTPAQFGSLRLVIAGAEKLPESLKQAFDGGKGGTVHPADRGEGAAADSARGKPSEEIRRVRVGGSAGESVASLHPRELWPRLFG